MLATLAVTLQSLKLHLTAYQMYAWAASAIPSEEFLTKTFTLGLAVLASPSRWDVASRTKIETHILSQMQVVALQLARLLAQKGEGTCTTRLATGWAAQAALWQLQWLPHDDKRQLILPRLAESMALRLVEQEEGSNGSAEVRLLCHKIFELQSKRPEMLDILEKDEIAGQQEQSEPQILSEFGVSFTSYQLQTMKAKLLSQTGDYVAAQIVYEDLLSQNPDDWSCWKGHLDCCTKIESIAVTASFVEKVLAQVGTSKYFLRAPHLMKVELAANALRCKRNQVSVQSLAEAIVTYGTAFGRRASCAFSDLESYIDVLLQSDDDNSGAKVLLMFSINMKKRYLPQPEVADMNANIDARPNLRAYIFAEKLNQKLLAFSKEYCDLSAADWTKLLAGWKNSVVLLESDGGEKVSTRVIEKFAGFCLIFIFKSHLICRF